MGRAVGRLLLDRIEGRVAPRVVVLDTEVVRRDSA